MKIMMIDPWGTGNHAYYLTGLCKYISKYVELTLVTNCYFHNKNYTDYTIIPIFFKKSENMKQSKLRKVIRGIEYIWAYGRVIKELKKNRYDIVHIQWLLQYKTDIYFLKKIKKYCKKIVYTAHNVLPHINGTEYISDLRVIYNLVDKIVLHGEGTKKEFESLFCQFEDKVIIQRHGTYLNQKTEYDTGSINMKIVAKVDKCRKIFIFFGNIFFNKGVDRIAEIWLHHFKKNHDQLLIIAGKKNGEYKELDLLEEEIKNCENIMYIDRYVEDNLLNYLIDKSDIIILPYRHASMSGVIFTAAEFKKTVLCTNTGAISEYIVAGENSFVVENDDEKIYEKLKFISNQISKEILKDMGIKLHDYIELNYSWASIGEKLVKDAYVND